MKTFTLYRHYSSAGDLLYIGATKNAQRRLKEHGCESAWFSQIARVEMEQFDTKVALFDAEREAIARERPAHNIETRRTLSPRSDAERQRDMRQRMRERGYVLRQFWVHPKDWERVQTYLLRVNKRRESHR